MFRFPNKFAIINVMKTLLKITLFFFIFSVLFLSAALTVRFVQFQELLILKNQSKTDQTIPTIVTTIPISTGTENMLTEEVPPNPLTKITHKILGTIKKEEIPVELDLGDYWYWIYMDAPLLVEDNAQGRPMNFKKIQIESPTPEVLNLDEFLDKKVEVSGNIGWGYAESNVFNAVSIVFVN